MYNYDKLLIKDKELKQRLKLQAVKEKVTLIELVERVLNNYLIGKE